VFGDVLDVPEDVAPPSLETRPTDARRPEGLRETGRGIVIGIVDWGLDPGHAEFRTSDGSTRLLGFWDQRGPARDASNRYGYGTIHAREDIDRALRSRDPYAALGYHPSIADTGQGAHGSVVGSIAAGNGRSGGPSGVAPEADIVFVHLAPIPQRPGAARPAFIGDYVTLLEAIDYIQHVAGERPLVINLSMGQHTGPHDGSTLVERGLDAAVIARPGLAIIHSAGNYFDGRIHVGGQLRPGEERRVRFVTDRADTTPQELDIWYSSRDRFVVELVAPDGRGRWRTALGERAEIRIDGRDCGSLYHRAHDPNNGDHHVDVFLYPTAPAGAWELVVIGEDVADGRYNAWIQRDAGCRACQARFRAEDADPSITLGSICTGLRTIATGAYDPHTPDHPIARFSSAGPTRDGRVKPDLLAPGVKILAARSAPRTGEAFTLTRMSGTSMAAPYVTGTIALMLEAVQGRPQIHELRSALLRACRPIADGDRGRAGSGYCDISAAVEWARSARPQPAPRVESAGADDVLEVVDVDETEVDEMDLAPTAEDEAAEIESDLEQESATIPPSVEGEMTMDVQGALPAEDRVGGCRCREGLGEVAAGDAEASRRDALSWILPIALYLGLRQQGTLPEPARDRFDLIAAPGERLAESVRDGDVLVSIANGGEALIARGSQLALSGGRLGVRATDATGGREHVRAITNAAGRMLPDRLLLRPKETAEAISATEDYREERAIQANRVYRASLAWDPEDGALQRALGISADLARDEAAFADAVRRWQQTRSLTADGILGPRTWERLRAEIGAGATLPATGARFTAQLPRSGAGFVAYARAQGQHGLPETITALETIARAWQQRHPEGPRIAIGDISLASGGNFPPHASHRNGVDVDIRPMRNDGRELPVRWYREGCDSSHCAPEAIDASCLVPEYSRELTQELVDLIHANGVLRVQYVFFNDCRVRGVRHWPGHDNHLHVRFIPTAPRAGDELAEIHPLPATRICCILAPTVSPFSSDSNLADPTSLGMHGSSSEVVGLLYTAAAGFVDLGHLRDLVDLTRYVYEEIAAASGAPGTVSTKHGEATIVRAIPSPEWLNVARCIALDDSFAYEILTWDEMYPGGHNSSFSPEDLPSNWMGTLIAARAIAAGGTFETAVTTELNTLLSTLGVRSKADALTAFNHINHHWVEFTGVLSLSSNAYLRRRNFGIAPWHAGMPYDTATPPWLSAKLPGCAAFYSYRNTTGRVIPSSSFGAELARIRADASARYGSSFESPAPGSIAMAASPAATPTAMPAVWSQLLAPLTAASPVRSASPSSTVTDWTTVPLADRARYVMTVLVDRYGYPVNGAAGLVGNLVAESGLIPNRIEGSRERTPMRARDFSGNEVDFTPDDVMNRDAATHTGPRLPGVGLAQWTTRARRSGLFRHVYQGQQLGTAILTNMDAQIDYLVNELRTQYPRVDAVLRTQGVNVDDATDEVVYNFEVPGAILDQGTPRRKLPRADPQVQQVFQERRRRAHVALQAYQAQP
jgi:hypothetical protein